MTKQTKKPKKTKWSMTTKKREDEKQVFDHTIYSIMINKMILIILGILLRGEDNTDRGTG